MAKKTDKKSKGEKKEFGYDESLDKVVKDFGKVEGQGGRAGDFSIRLMSYNSGPIKLSLSRTGTNKETGEPWFSPKLGRLTIKEVEALIERLPTVLKTMKKKAKKSSSEDEE